MPGIAVECWGHEGPFGAEGYGWAATLPLHIIRSLIGFRECQANFQNSFFINPNFPNELLITKKKYIVRDLKFQNKKVSLDFVVLSSEDILCKLSIRSDHDFHVYVLDDAGKLIHKSKNRDHLQTFKFKIENRQQVQVQFQY